MPDTCNHGYFATDCALCVKRPGECDHGSCTAPAVRRVEVRTLSGRLIEARPMCHAHAPHEVHA